MQFRRHGETVTEQGKGFIAKTKTIFRIFGSDKNKRYKQVKYINEVLGDYIDRTQIQLVNDILKYQKSFMIKMRLLIKKDLNCNILPVDLVNRIAILLNCY